MALVWSCHLPVISLVYILIYFSGQLKKDKSGEASCSLCCVLLWCHDWQWPIRDIVMKWVTESDIISPKRWTKDSLWLARVFYSLQGNILTFLAPSAHRGKSTITWQATKKTLLKLLQWKQSWCHSDKLIGSCRTNDQTRL